MKYILVCIILISATFAINKHSDPRHKGRSRRSIEDNEKFFPKPVSDENKDYWYEVSHNEIVGALQRPPNNVNKAKNVILFLGDGMSMQTITAARIYKGQKSNFSGEEAVLSFEEFPNVALSKVYNTNSQVPDSAGTGTAYLSGVKTKIGTLGFDNNIVREDCTTMLDEYKVQSIAKWSQDVGKRTGFVTTTRVTHATPANMYAHVAERDWEVDEGLPAGYETECPDLKDIAAQLVDTAPGNKLNVIMGGGYEVMSPDAIGTEFDPLSDYIGTRQDGRHLDQEWLTAKENSNQTAKVIRTRTELLELMNKTLLEEDFVMGLFANDHLPYNHITRENNLDKPSLAEMTETAIKVLDKADEGFFLLVEGGKIDWAHHDGLAGTALDETFEFDAAITRALELVDTDETLVIATADHAHTMSLSGYPDRGTIITGIADEDRDDVPYTTLLYGNGPGYHYKAVNGEVVREDPSQNDTSNLNFVYQSAVPREFAAHSGDDVPIYAIGPWSHLFYAVHEQHFIAHAMAYASCVGLYQDPCLASYQNLSKYKNKKTKKTHQEMLHKSTLLQLIKH